MNDPDENNDIRQTLKQAMPDDLPAAVAERLHDRLAAFRQRLDAEPPAAGSSLMPSLLRRRLIGWTTAAVATVALLLAVLFISQAWRSAESVAWADVVAAVAKKPWLHYVHTWKDGTRKEGWYSASRAVEGSHDMPSGPGHGVETYIWTDFAQQKNWLYYPHAHKIVHGTQSQKHWDARQFFSVAWNTAYLSGNVGGSVRAGGYEIVDQQQRVVTEGGKRWIEYRFRWRQTDKETLSATQFVVFVDPDTRLPFRMDLIGSNAAAVPFEQIDYPASGPADIYAMGVPKTAEIVDCSLRPEVERLAKATVAAGCRENIEFSALVVTSYPGHSWAYRAWKKGLRWKVDQTVGLLISPVDQVPSKEPDLARWWQQKAERATFAPYALFDGQWHWKYETKTRRPTPAEIAAGTDKKARILVSSEKKKLLPWPREYYWEESPLCLMGHPTTLDESPPSGLPIYGQGAPMLATIDPAPTGGPPNTVLLELRDPVWQAWKLADSDRRHPRVPQLVRFWIDPGRNHLVMRRDELIAPEGKEERIAGFLVEGLTQGPGKQWFPTVVHELVHILPPDSHKDMEDIVTRFYYDFTIPIPDSLFKAE